MKKGKILIAVFLIFAVLISGLLIACWDLPYDCTACGGSGECAACNGEGKSVFNLSNLGHEYRDCTPCNKSGICKTCDGTGKIR